MTAHEIIDDLSLRSRAYQLLYALEDTPASRMVPTLLAGEAEMWIKTAQEVLAGDRSTELRRKLATINPVVLRYVATGAIGIQEESHA